MSKESNREPRSLIRDALRDIDKLKKSLSKAGGDRLWSSKIKEEIREFVLYYFKDLRIAFVAAKIATEDFDLSMQKLFDLTNRSASIPTYRQTLSDVRTSLNKYGILIESDDEISPPRDRSTLSRTDEMILSTLQALIPFTALSYQQVLLDIDDPTRTSYRGTAAELREVLRETLDHLAPEKEIMGEPGFTLDKGLLKPSMRQKARYILKLRGKASNSITAPEKAIGIVDEKVSMLVRSTYDRGSNEAHTASGISKPNLLQLKMYVDTVLCELLEIHQSSPTNIGLSQ